MKQLVFRLRSRAGHVAKKWVGSSISCAQSLQVEEPTSSSPLLFRKRAASDSSSWQPRMRRILKLFLAGRCSRSSLWVLIVQRVDGLPERGSIWDRRCRLHLCSASSSRDISALAWIMPDTTLFHGKSVSFTDSVLISCSHS